jgi:hypothetical protein
MLQSFNDFGGIVHGQCRLCDLGERLGRIGKLDNFGLFLGFY